MELIPIKKTLEENHEFFDNPDCLASLQMSIDFYNRVGYVVPWIGYFVSMDNEIVGGAGFKGPPANGTVEIAYGTFEHVRSKGIGTAMCNMLVDIARKTDSGLRITARTLPEKNHSTIILEKQF